MSKPLTKEFLLSRGKCCNNGCKNCPYKDLGKIKDQFIKDNALGILLTEKEELISSSNQNISVVLQKINNRLNNQHKNN